MENNLHQSSVPVNVMGLIAQMFISFQKFTAIPLVLLLSSCATAPPEHLAVTNGNLLHILDAAAGQTVQTVNRYQEVMGLAYRPDGQHLAIAECFQNEVIELAGTNYAELSVAVSASSCPWDITYSPDNASLAAAVPVRPNPLGAMSGHLRIAGPQPLDRSFGRPLPALAYRPGGQELAVSTPQGLRILGTGPTYPTLQTLANVEAVSLGYTIDGSHLIVGLPNGYAVYDAAGNYSLLSNNASDPVIDVDVDPTGEWVALVRPNRVDLLRTPDLQQAHTLNTTGSFRDAAFSRNGRVLSVAESVDVVRFYRTQDWVEQSPILLTGRIDAVDFQPDGLPRIPVVFVHGHSRNANEAWFESGSGLGTMSFASALSANSTLPIDAFYLDLPTHNGSQNVNRSIEQDAEDILAVVEGGLDSTGRLHVGILNLPAYQATGRVALVGYSQGGLTSRYYIKNLMGTRSNGAKTVAEFVALAVPTHGIGGSGLLGCGTSNESDKARRQLCGGRQAEGLLNSTQGCGACNPTPAFFTSNSGSDATFLSDLNGHPFDLAACDVNLGHPNEAPHSRPTTPDGVLYVNLYAENNADRIVGGHDRTSLLGGDCLGRRLARNLAPDAVNREISVPILGVHSNFPHQWEVMCFTLRTIVDHAAPANVQQACQGLTPP